VGWQGHIEKDGLAGVLHLAVTSQSGLFREFVKAAGNSAALTLHVDNDNLYSIRADHGEPRFTRSEQKAITLLQLLERDHRLESTFSKVTGEFPKVHRARVRVEGAYKPDVSSKSHLPVTKWTPMSLRFQLRGKSPRLNADLARSSFGETTGVRTIGGPRYMHVPLYHVEWTSGVEPGKVPMLVGEGHSTFLSENFEGGDRLTLLHRTYILAFFLGMLSRYHPAVWVSLLQNQKGAAAQPLIRAALDAVEIDFPILLWQHLDARNSAAIM
jgi:hypothetical protein